MRAASAGGVGDTPLLSSLTGVGAQVFDYLNSSAAIPIVQSYVYRNQIDAACGGQLVLTGGNDVLGVLTHVHGRARAARP